MKNVRVVHGPDHDCELPMLYPKYKGTQVIWKCPACKRKWEIWVTGQAQSSKTISDVSFWWSLRESRRRGL